MKHHENMEYLEERRLEEKKELMRELIELRNKVTVMQKIIDDFRQERCDLRTAMYQILIQIPDDLVERKCKNLYPQLGDE